MKIEPVEVEKMSLTMARIVTHKNLRPELNPAFQKEGYLVDDASWLKEDEFLAAPLYPADKEGTL